MTILTDLKKNKQKKTNLNLANYSRVSISGESGILHDHGEMLYFGQQRPGRTIVTLIWDLEWWQTLTGQAEQRRKHGRAYL